MARRPNFRSDGDLQKEFRRVNKLVQNKQSKLRRQEGLETVGVSTQKYKEFGSRKEINSYLKNMEKFLHNKVDFDVTNAHGVQDHYSEIKKLERGIKKTNRDKEKLWDKVKDLPYLHKGVPLGEGITVGMMRDPVVGMGLSRFADLDPTNIQPFWQFENKRDWENYKNKKIELHGDGEFLNKLNELYKDNYIKGLQKELGVSSKKLQQHIRDMSMEDFMIRSFSENNAHLHFIYDEMEHAAILAELMDLWDVPDEETKIKPRKRRRKNKQRNKRGKNK
jgi:hypothetical protein